MKWLLGAVLLAVACGMNPPPPPPGSGAAGTGTGPTGSADAGSGGPSSSATPEQLTSGESAGGNITLEGSGRELLANPKVKAAYLGTH